MSEQQGPMLSGEEEILLLRIARDSLETYVREARTIDVEDYPLTQRLREKHGAFVTLRHGGELRGCIGYTRNLEPLAETVRDNAINAGTRDPRFPPIKKDELDGISIEISALCSPPNPDVPDSPFIKVNGLSEIVIGRDGLYLDHAGPRGGGLLLPQVAVEQGWDIEQFLSGLCRKAGSPDKSWNDPGSTLYRFQAQVFREERS